MPFAHDRYAKEYDDLVKSYNCHIADVLFGLSYEYLKKGESLLDVGIGTGLSSRCFNQAGVEITGIDGSTEMLKICAAKGFARQLINQDLLNLPWPLQDDQFDHVVCCGVFHFLGELDDLFMEVSRVQKKGGIFAFTEMAGRTDLNNQAKYSNKLEDGLMVYTHQFVYIDHLVKTAGYSIEKEVISLVGDTPFRCLLGVKRGSPN
jgi:predicted TPR repeat methyltransferase